MSFTPDIFKRKLSSLSETQDSIVTISQWILFHHRHSKEIAQAWAQYLMDLDSQPGQSSKKLSLLYLCNDVVQQARHKRKPEFIHSFAEVLPSVFSSTYHAVNDNIKPKITRLINVWEDRSVFNADEIKSLRDAVKNSGSSNKNVASHNSNGENKNGTVKIEIAPELVHINNYLLQIKRLNDTNQGNLQQITSQSRQYLPEDPSMSDNLPSPNIYLSKLSILEKLCNLATSNINSIKNDRQRVLGQVESLLEIVKGAIKTDESKLDLVSNTLERLKTTRSELQEMTGETETEEKQEAPLKSIINNRKYSADASNGPKIDDESNDEIPTYAPDSDEEVEEGDDDESSLRSNKRQRTSRTPSFSSGSSTPSKRVAFSEDVQIKEYEREEQTELINIMKSTEEHGNENDENDDSDDSDYNPVSNFDPVDYEKHHKDVIDLKHDEDSKECVQNDVMSILSKLA